MSEDAEFVIEAEDLADGVALVRTVVPEIRHPGTSTRLGDDLRSIIRQGRTRIVLDLGQTRYLSSSGFAALINVARKLGEQGGRIAIGRIHPDVLVGSKIIGLGKIIPILDDIRSAEAFVGLN